MTHHVYRCYNGDGALLYIGCTGTTVAQRLRQHRYARAPWLPRMSFCTAEPYPSAALGFLAESRAICEESPEYNIARRDMRSERGARALPSERDTFRYTPSEWAAWQTAAEKAGMTVEDYQAWHAAQRRSA